jgi:hypothetical protein
MLLDSTVTCQTLCVHGVVIANTVYLECYIPELQLPQSLPAMASHTPLAALARAPALLLYRRSALEKRLQGSKQAKLEKFQFAKLQVQLDSVHACICAHCCSSIISPKTLMTHGLAAAFACTYQLVYAFYSGVIAVCRQSFRTPVTSVTAETNTAYTSYCTPY